MTLSSIPMLFYYLGHFPCRLLSFSVPGRTLSSNRWTSLLFPKVNCMHYDVTVEGGWVIKKHKYTTVLLRPLNDFLTNAKMTSHEFRLFWSLPLSCLMSSYHKINNPTIPICVTSFMNAPLLVQSLFELVTLWVWIKIIVITKFYIYSIQMASEY